MENRTKIDYLTVSFRESIPAVKACLAHVFKGLPGGPEWGETKPGVQRFENRVEILLGGQMGGLVLWGGATQRGKAAVQISGTGCGHVRDWDRADEALHELPGAKFTRTDIALDSYRGEVTHERMEAAHAAGKFRRDGGGRYPEMSQIISSNEARQRTIYVGRRGGDRMARGYEKGKKEFWGASNALLRKLGDELIEGVRWGGAGSKVNGGEAFDLAKWYRVELEMRNAHTPIPLDVISRRDEYFAGAWPWFSELLPEAEGQILVRPREMGIIAIERALEQVNKQYGRILYTGLVYLGGDYLALCDRVVGKEHSEKLVAAGALLAIEDEKAAVKRVLQEASAEVATMSALSKMRNVA